MTTTMSLSDVTSSSPADSSTSTYSSQTPDGNSTQDYNSTSSMGLSNTVNVTTLKANDMTSSTVATTQTTNLSTSLPTGEMSVGASESLTSGKTVVTTHTSNTLMTSTSASPTDAGSVKPTQTEVVRVRTPLFTVLMTKLSTTDVFLSTDLMTSEKSIVMMTSQKMMKHSTIKRATILPSSDSYTTMKAIDDVIAPHQNATATIIVSIVAVVFFVAVLAIALICVCRRRNKKNKSRTLMANQPPTFHASHRALDFENLNDASSPGEFLMDKAIIDLESSPNTDNNAMQALALLDNATEEFGSKEIITFKTGSHEELGEKNGNVPNKSEHASDSDSEEGNSEPDEKDEKDEKDRADEKENKESSDTKIEDSVLNKENTNGEKMEKELVVGTETKLEESEPTTMESNSEPKDMEISGKEESDNKPIPGSENKTDGITPVSEL
nr:uncharacterized protein LOC105346636 isoform X2 [Crassostrea gigas]